MGKEQDYKWCNQTKGALSPKKTRSYGKA